MDTFIEARDCQGLQLAGEGHKVPPLDPEIWKRHIPSMHFCLLRDYQLVARCSIWTESTPKLLNKCAGVLGHCAAVETSVGAILLKHVTDRFRHRGLQSVVGPLDGNTWRRYRLLTQRGDERPFFLEPDNPNDWPDHFAAAGFSPLARYFSALNQDLFVTDPRVPAALIRLNESGVRIRQIDAARFEEELKAVHELSLDAFSDNFLYTPIDQAEFLAMYAPLKQHLRPELVLLAEKDSQLVGFIFGLPDLMQAQRGERIKLHTTPKE